MHIFYEVMGRYICFLTLTTFKITSKNVVNPTKSWCLFMDTINNGFIAIYLLKLCNKVFWRQWQKERWRFSWHTSLQNTKVYAFVVVRCKEQFCFIPINFHTDSCVVSGYSYTIIDPVYLMNRTYNWSINRQKYKVHVLWSHEMLLNVFTGQ